jgi:hypothetical protein
MVITQQHSIRNLILAMPRIENVTQSTLHRVLLLRRPSKKPRPFAARALEVWHSIPPDAALHTRQTKQREGSRFAFAQEHALKVIHSTRVGCRQVFGPEWGNAPGGDAGRKGASVRASTERSREPSATDAVVGYKAVAQNCIRSLVLDPTAPNRRRWRFWLAADKSNLSQQPMRVCVRQLIKPSRFCGISLLFV